MRLAATLVAFVALAAAPALCQNTLVAANLPVAATSAHDSANPAPAAASTAAETNPSVNYASLREDVMRQNKVLQDQVNGQKAILKKNQELLKEAQKINAANLKLAEEKKRLEQANVELDKQRAGLKAAQQPAATN